MKTTPKPSVNPSEDGEDVKAKKQLLVRQPQESYCLDTPRMNKRESSPPDTFRRAMTGHYKSQLTSCSFWCGVRDSGIIKQKNTNFPEPDLGCMGYLRDAAEDGVVRTKGSVASLRHNALIVVTLGESASLATGLVATVHPSRLVQ